MSGVVFHRGKELHNPARKASEVGSNALERCGGFGPRREDGRSIVFDEIGWKIECWEEERKGKVRKGKVRINKKRQGKARKGKERKGKKR